MKFTAYPCRRSWITSGSPHDVINICLVICTRGILRCISCPVHALQLGLQFHYSGGPTEIKTKIVMQRLHVSRYHELHISTWKSLHLLPKTRLESNLTYYSFQKFPTISSIILFLVSIANQIECSIRIFERFIRVYQFLETFQLLSAGIYVILSAIYQFNPFYS